MRMRLEAAATSSVMKSRLGGLRRIYRSAERRADFLSDQGDRVYAAASGMKMDSINYFLRGPDWAPIHHIQSLFHFISFSPARYEYES